jgi:hypothetical protein
VAQYPDAGIENTLFYRLVKGEAARCEREEPELIPIPEFPLTIAGRVASRLESAYHPDLKQQQEAMRRFPDLGAADGRLNQLFLAERNRRITEAPRFFEAPDWPVLLADECTKQLDAMRKPETPLPALLAETPTRDATRGRQTTTVPPHSSRIKEDIVGTQTVGVMIAAGVFGFLIIFVIGGLLNSLKEGRHGLPSLSPAWPSALLSSASRSHRTHLRPLRRFVRARSLFQLSLTRGGGADH